MNPSRELPCYMNSSSTKMLQIPSEMRGSNSKMLQIPLKQQLPAPKCYKFHQHVANSMENERFQLQTVAKTVEMAASSSKMLQLARKTCRKNGSNSGASGKMLDFSNDFSKNKLVRSMGFPMVISR